MVDGRTASNDFPKRIDPMFRAGPKYFDKKGRQDIQQYTHVLIAFDPVISDEAQDQYKFVLSGCVSANKVGSPTMDGSDLQTTFGACTLPILQTDGYCAI